MAWLIADPVVAARHVLAPDFIADGTAHPDFPNWPGAYALLLRLDDALDVSFGRQHSRLVAGWYAYAGSARGPGGGGARIARHLRHDKKPHWHIDRLTLRSRRVIALALADADECTVAARLCERGQYSHVLPGFGSSDCAACVSHLLGWQAIGRDQSQ